RGRRHGEARDEHREQEQGQESWPADPSVHWTMVPRDTPCVTPPEGPARPPRPLRVAPRPKAPPALTPRLSGIIPSAPLASGQAVRRLTLDQEIEGSNPSSPANIRTCKTAPGGDSEGRRDSIRLARWSSCAGTRPTWPDPPGGPPDR